MIDDLDLTRINKFANSSDSLEKRVIRRKSCCCGWCGGITKLERKHNDLVIKKILNEESTPLKLTPISSDGDKTTFHNVSKAISNKF